VLICLDEFSVFLDTILKRNREEGEQLVGWLRTWRQQETACRFIFSGSIGINSLLIRNRLVTAFNDCYEFPLGPFSRPAALSMLKEEARRENLDVSNEVLEYLCEKIGWLSPFFLNQLFYGAQNAARERIDEQRLTDANNIQHNDVDLAYQRLIAHNSRFFHWYQRLERDLAEPELGMTKAILSFVARAKEGLSKKQLNVRLSRLEANPEVRRERMNLMLDFLHENGYLTREEPIRFLSFLLRDYWKQNHAG
jgi:hypothetical protein